MKTSKLQDKFLKVITSRIYNTSFLVASLSFSHITKMLVIEMVVIQCNAVVDLDLDSGGRREQYLYYVARESLSK